MSSLSAKNPITNGTISIPSHKYSLPKVYLRTPNTELNPIKDRRIPTPPAARPFTIFCRDANVTAINPRITIQKKSGGVNQRIKSLATGNNAAKTTMLNRVPSPDAVAASPIARPPSPRLVIGKPSNVVHTFAIVPGVLSKIAGTAPPVLAVPMIPAKTYIATIGSHPKVKGMMSVIAITLPRPGITPNITPSNVPRQMAAMTAGSLMFANAAIIASIICYHRMSHYQIITSTVIWL